MADDDQKLPGGMYVYKPRAGAWGGAPFDPERCAASVYGEGAYHSYQCRNKVKFHERGFGWCGVHRPSKVDVRRAKRDAKFQYDWDLSQMRGVRNERYNQIAKVAIDHFNQKASFEDLEAAVLSYAKATADIEEFLRVNKPETYKRKGKG